MTIKEHKENIKKFKEKLKYVVGEYNDSFETMEDFIKHLEKDIKIEYLPMSFPNVSASFFDTKKIYIDEKYKGNNFLIIKEYFKVTNGVYPQTPIEELVGPFDKDYVTESGLFAYAVLKELNMEDDIPYELDLMWNKDREYFKRYKE